MDIYIDVMGPLIMLGLFLIVFVLFVCLVIAIIRWLNRH